MFAAPVKLSFKKYWNPVPPMAEPAASAGLANSPTPMAAVVAPAAKRAAILMKVPRFADAPAAAAWGLWHGRQASPVKDGGACRLVATPASACAVVTSQPGEP